MLGLLWQSTVLSIYFNNLIKKIKSHHGFQRYFANTSWLFAEQIVRLVAALFVGIWVARYLGPYKFGVFSYAVAFVAIFASIAKLGLDGIIVRDLVHEPEKRDIYLGTGFWLKVIGAFISIALLAFSSFIFTSNAPIINIYIFIIASGVVFQSFEVIDFYFQSQVLSKYVSLCKLMQLFISSVVKIYFIINGKDLIWFVVVSLIDQITLAFSLHFAYGFQKIKYFYRFFDLVIAKKLLKDSWPLIFSGLVIMIYMRIDQIMLKEMLGEREVGLYSAAVRLSEAWYFVPMVITSSLFPAIVSAKKVNRETYETRLERLYAFLVWLAIVIASLMTLLSDWLVPLLYGQAYQEASKILVIQTWAGVFVFLGVASSRWYLNENLQKISTFNTVIGGFSNIYLNLLLIPKYGVYGAAFSTLISYAISAYFMNLAFSRTRANFFRMTKSIYTYR